MIVESYEDIIILSGALRSNFWDTIHTAISLTLKRHPSGVIIDCSGIDECTPAGAETFRDAMEFIRRFDARIIVAAVPPSVHEVLKSVPEVRSQLPIADTIENARRSLDLLTEEGGKKTRRKEVERTVLVMLEGVESDAYAIKQAVEQSDRIPTEVCLLFPILVPRELPIHSPMPEAEDLAKRTLESHRKMLEAAEVSTSLRIERARDIAGAIEEALQEVPASLVLIGLSSDFHEKEASLKVMKTVLAKVALPLMFVRDRNPS